MEGVGHMAPEVRSLCVTIAWAFDGYCLVRYTLTVIPCICSHVLNNCGSRLDVCVCVCLCVCVCVCGVYAHSLEQMCSIQSSW